MRKLGYVGIPTALSLATPKPRHRKKTRRPTVPVSFPVFYDKSGKRLRRLVLAGGVLLLAFAALTACVAPAMFASTWTTATNSDNGFPRRFLATGDTHNMPVIGEGVFTRVVRAEQEHTGTGAPPGPPGVGEALRAAQLVDPDAPEAPPMPPIRLIDPITGEFIRYADDGEQEYISDSPYAIEHFGQVPDRTLILTFDDGPDPTWTPEILNILSREHVPVTFFVIGEQVAMNPEVFRRLVREGHMAANHTFTHIDFDHEGDFRNREEIILAERIIRATAGYDTRLFRMPYGDPDNNPLGQLQGQQLGQIHVGYTIDTADWDHPPGEAVPVPPLDGRGHVLLMHDAGGDRAGTVAMLEKLIAEARAQGYTFTTLAPMLPPQDIPQHDVAPTLMDRVTLLVAQAVYVLPGKLLAGAFWFGVGSMLILTALYLLLSSINEWRQRRRVWPDTPDDELPFLSVVLAAYNEEKVIERTLAMLRESDYPASKFEVIAVNDGSSDTTLSILRDYASTWPSLCVVDQPNSGKSSALNNAINHADRRSTVIITMDADTLFRKTTIRMLARHFVKRHRRKMVGAVAGHVKVGNRRNVLTAWQSLEYLNGICIIRMAEMMVGAVGIVPGACSAWRRSALEQIGGFSEDTLAEDADAAMTFQRLGYAVIHENAALCDTEAPETLVPLLKQRKRWMFGNFQVMWKNRAMLLRPRYGMLGMLTMPYSVAQLLLNLLFLPILLVVTGVTLAQGDWQPIVSFAVVVLIMHTMIAITAVVIARERLWHLLVVPIYRPIYEAMRIYLLYACAYRVLKGAEFSWDKLERRNSVVAAEAHPLIERNHHEEERKTHGRAVVLSGDGDDRLRVDDELVSLGAVVHGEPSRV